MLRHADIWAAIDRLAQENGFSASGLARRAGLDPTTFNRSKRITREGKTRWPSTESIAKILEATNTSLPHFVALVSQEQPSNGRPRTVPLSNLAAIRGDHHFDGDGHPTGDGWDAIALPDVTDPHAFALEVRGNDLEPVYHDGDVLIVSPNVPPRRGDRVFVCTQAGNVMVRRLLRHSAKRIELQPLSNNGGELTFGLDEISALARIVWASQ
jgi:phage repressor protein C with HTH and peptisase S24 domain